MLSGAGAGAVSDFKRINRDSLLQQRAARRQTSTLKRKAKQSAD
jgi:hypothetical protein